MKDKKNKNKEKKQEDLEIEYRIKPPKCSFCGRSADKVEKIIQGMNNSAFICDECIRVCYNMIMETGNVPTYTPEEFNEKLKKDIEEENNNHENLSYKIFYIDMQREKLYERINKRADIMLDEGIIEETKIVIKKIADRQNKSIYDILDNYNVITSLQAIGYREVIAYLKNEIDYEEMKEKILIKQEQ